MKTETREKHICPKCGKPFCEPPALSRIDAVYICPDCGIREALDSIGVSEEEQEQILNSIHGFKSGK